jgi:hypothetical protein
LQQGWGKEDQLIALPELRLSQLHAAQARQGSLQKRSGLQADFEGPSALQGFTSQTHTHSKPLNRQLIPLSKEQKFMDFSKCLENSQNFSEHEKCPKKVRFQR